MKVKILRTKEADKVFGKIVRMEFPNRSRIYISKKGWTLTLPKTKKILNLIKKKDRIEIILPYEEINLALNETKLAGYVEKKPRKEYFAKESARRILRLLKNG